MIQHKRNTKLILFAGLALLLMIQGNAAAVPMMEKTDITSVTPTVPAPGDTTAPEKPPAEEIPVDDMGDDALEAPDPKPSEAPWQIRPYIDQLKSIRTTAEELLEVINDDLKTVSKKLAAMDSINSRMLSLKALMMLTPADSGAPGMDLTNFDGLYSIVSQVLKMRKEKKNLIKVKNDLATLLGGIISYQGQLEAAEAANNWWVTHDQATIQKNLEDYSKSIETKKNLAEAHVKNFNSHYADAKPRIESYLTAIESVIDFHAKKTPPTHLNTNNRRQVVARTKALRKAYEALPA